MNAFLKKFFKTVTAVTLAVSVAAAAYIPAQASPSIKDLDSSSEYARASIEKLVAANVIQGDENGYFNPRNTLTRAEMVTLMVKALDFDVSDIPSTPTFNDIPADHWAFKYVESAYKNGLIKGVSDNFFDSEQNCTREQLAVIFIRAMGINDTDISGKQEHLFIGKLLDKDSIDSWAEDFIEFALESGLMKGTGSGYFDAKQSAEREQAAVLVDRILENRENIIKAFKAFSGDVEHPELYAAMRKNAVGYEGNFDSGLDVAIKNNTLDETITIKYSITGAMKAEDFDVDATITSQIPGADPLEVSYQMIRIGGTNYIKASGSDEWQVIPTEDLSDLGEILAAKSGQMDILRSFSDFAVTKTEDVTIDDKAATKYTVEITGETIKAAFPDLFSTTLPEYAPGLVEEIFNNGFECKIEIYLDENKDVIHETYSLSAGILSEEDALDLSISAKIENMYFNIGNIPEIKAP